MTSRCKIIYVALESRKKLHNRIKMLIAIAIITNEHNDTRSRNNNNNNRKER